MPLMTASAFSTAGTTLVEAVSEIPGKGAYFVEAVGGKAVETRIEPRPLPRD